MWTDWKNIYLSIDIYIFWLFVLIIISLIYLCYRMDRLENQ